MPTFIVMSANVWKSLSRMACLISVILRGTIFSARCVSSSLVLTDVCIPAVLPTCFFLALTYTHTVIVDTDSSSRLDIANQLDTASHNSTAIIWTATSLSRLTWDVHFVSWTLASGCITCNQSATNVACVCRNNSYSIYIAYYCAQTW